MGDHQPPGINPDDLPGIYREGYLYSTEMSRAMHDPATEWDEFREYLWQALIRVFGLDVDLDWPGDVPGPKLSSAESERSKDDQVGGETVHQVAVHVTDWESIEPTAVGAMESRTAQLGGVVVTRHRIPAGFDSAPYYRGLPDDMCPCEHWCYLVRGRMQYRYADGSTQLVEAGQAFLARRGHLADVLEDSELIEFTQVDEYARKADHIAATSGEHP